MYAKSFLALDGNGRLTGARTAQTAPYAHYTCHLCGSTFEQCFHLLTVGIGQFIVAQGTKSRIVHIGTHRAGLVRRSYGACHKTGFVGSKRSKLICHFACQAHCGKIHLAHIVLHMIIGHTDAGGTECICFDNIRTCRQILAVNVLYHIGFSGHPSELSQ